MKPTSLPKDYYETWKKKHFKSENSNQASRKDFDIVKEERERFEQLRIARQNSCYLSMGKEIAPSVVTTGGDWNDKWDTDDKIKLMWSLYGAFANSQSNVKSPMTSGRISAFVNQMKRLNFAYDAFPNNKEDKNAAKVASKVLNYTEKTTDSRAQRLLAMEDAATYGDGFYRETYLFEKRKRRYPKIKDLTKEEEKIIEDGGIVFGEEKEEVVQDTPTSIYIPIRELYWDSTARTDHGPAYAARDVIWRRVLPVDVAKKLLKDMPNTKNINKIKACSGYIKDPSYSGFFTPPEDTLGGEYVEWLEHENEAEDFLRITVNDICVLDIPMREAHKELSFHKLSYKLQPGQFYSRGLCDELRMIQGAEEVIANMATDYIFRSYVTKWIVGSSVSGEITDEAMSGDQSIITVDDDGGMIDVRTKLQQVVTSPIGFDLFRLFDTYERQATVASGVDPSQLSVLATGKTATATLQNKEQLELTISGVVDNFVNGALKNSGRQRWANIKQHWKLPRLKDIMGDTEKKSKPRMIRLDGIELKINADTKDLDVVDSENDYSFFELKDEYLNTKDELDIIIAPDSIDIQSKALQQQTAKQEFAQYVPFAVDPNNAQQMATHPAPYVNGPKLFEWYNAQMNNPSDLLITPEQNEKVAEEKAEKEVMRILNGENVPGTPGESIAGRKYKFKVLTAIGATIQELEDQIVTDMNNQVKDMQPMFDPMTGQPLPPPEPTPNMELVNRAESIKKKHKALSANLAMSNLPAGVVDVGAAKPPQNGPEMPPTAPMPPGGGMPQQGGEIVPQMEGGMMGGMQ